MTDLVVIVNRRPGQCLGCSRQVPPDHGYAVKSGSSWSVYHRDCAPDGVAPAPRLSIGQQMGYGAAPDATIVVRHVGDRIQIRPAGYLGADLFDSYRGACGGAEYNRTERCNYATVELVGAIVTRLVKAGFKLDVDPGVTAAVQAWEARAKADTAAADGRAAEIDARLRERGLALFPFQAQGVSWLAPLKSAILGDDMGLGKTVQALAALPEQVPVLVVGPAVAKGVWKRECARWRPDMRVTVLDGRGSFRWPAPGEMVVTNFDILPDAPMAADELKKVTDEIKYIDTKIVPPITADQSARRAKLQAKIDANASALVLMAAAPAGLCVIADEAHAVKGSRKKVARCARFGAVSDATYDVARGRIWLLTATPILNRPPELWNLLGLIRSQKVVFGSYPNFKRLCGGSDNGWGTTWGAGGIQASAIAPKLREVMLRRLKTDVLDQLPAKTVEVVEVSLDADSLKKLDAIKAELAAQGIDIVAALRAAADNRSIAFEQIARARAILATAKTAAAMELADELAEAGEPVVVFSAHRAPVDAMAKRDGWASITGDTAPATRTQIEEAFQRGGYRGVSGTIKAAGVAITLTRACNAIFVDSEWTPKLNEQAEDRIYRIGQAQAVKITYLKANHEIDERVFELCEIKRRIVARTVDAAAHREGSLAERTDAAAALEGARASSERAQRQRDNEALAERINRDRARADADRVRSRAAAKAEAANASRGWRIPVEAFDTPPRAARTPAEEWAVAALAKLTAMDGDHAFEENGVGFNKADTFVGQALAAAARDGLLSTGEWQVAIRLLAKYGRQVGRVPGATENESEVSA